MTFDEQATTLDRKSIVELLVSQQQLTGRVQELTRQLDWFKRQMFDSKSERRFVDPDGRQLALGEWKQQDAPGVEITVAEHQRRSRKQPRKDSEEDGLRFDESVPVEEIRVPHPALDADHEIISEKVTYRLAQRSASYVLLKYIRPVIKRKQDGKITCSPAPAAIFGKSLADVSLLACMVIDKFRYHLPLYRQHQRMAAAGIRLARSTLTGLVHGGAMSNGGEHMVERHAVGHVVVDVARGNQGDPRPTGKPDRAGQPTPIVGSPLELGQEVTAVGEDLANLTQRGLLGSGGFCRRIRTRHLPLRRGENPGEQAVAILGHVVERQLALALGGPASAACDQSGKPAVGRPIGSPQDERWRVDQFDLGTDQ